MIGVPEKDRDTGERRLSPAAGRHRDPGGTARFPDGPAELKIKGNIHYEEYW